MRYRYFKFSIDDLNLLRQDTVTGALEWVRMDGHSNPHKALSKLEYYLNSAADSEYTVTDVTDRFLDPIFCVPEGL